MYRSITSVKANE